MALPYAEFDLGDSGDRWTAERMCRHFKVENPAQVQFAFRVNSPARLRQMIDNRATVNVIQTEIVYSQMEVGVVTCHSRVSGWSHGTIPDVSSSGVF
jgi:hypothetical protein